MSLLVDYRCDACGAVSDEFVASPIPPTTACRTCGAPARRVYGVAGLLGVGLRKATKERLAAERAEQATGPSAGGHRHHDHHHHDHHHHGHSHSHDRGGDGHADAPDNDGPGD